MVVRLSLVIKFDDSSVVDIGTSIVKVDVGASFTTMEVRPSVVVVVGDSSVGVIGASVVVFSDTILFASVFVIGASV